MKYTNSVLFQTSSCFSSEKLSKHHRQNRSQITAVLIPYSSGHLVKLTIRKLLPYQHNVLIPYSSGHFIKLNAIPINHTTTAVLIPYSSGHFIKRTAGQLSVQRWTGLNPLFIRSFYQTGRLNTIFHN